MPTITTTLQPDATDGKDSYISAVAPTTNYGTTNPAIITYWPSDDKRMLIDFYPIIIKEFPKWKKVLIKQVYIDLNISAVSSAGQVVTLMYEILRDWVESEVTWNNWKAGNAWTTPGATGAGDSNVTPFLISTAVIATGSQKYYIDPYYFYRMMDRTNYGFMLYPDRNLGVNRSYSPDTSDDATVADRPKLVIVHEPYIKIFPISAGLGQVR